MESAWGLVWMAERVKGLVQRDVLLLYSKEMMARVYENLSIE